MLEVWVTVASSDGGRLAGVLYVPGRVTAGSVRKLGLPYGEPAVLALLGLSLEQPTGLPQPALRHRGTLSEQQ